MDNTIAKYRGQKDKHWSTKHYTEDERFNKTNHTKNHGWNQVPRGVSSFYSILKYKMYVGDIYLFISKVALNTINLRQTSLRNLYIYVRLFSAVHYLLFTF